MRPVEGTILTVVRAAAEAAERRATRGAGARRLLDAALPTPRDERCAHPRAAARC